MQRSDEQVLQFKSTSSPFQEDGGEPLLSNSEGLQSSDRSAQDQGMNVMSSYQKKTHKHYLGFCLFFKERLATVICIKIWFKKEKHLKNIKFIYDQKWTISIFCTAALWWWMYITAAKERLK